MTTIRSNDVAGRVLVVGSANMDLVVSCDRFPTPGETLLARDFNMFPGGKGANQAVACARLGGEVQFLGKVGNDDFGTRLLSSLKSDGVHTDGVLAEKDGVTGIALITVDGAGENQILVVSGSNMRLIPQDIEDHGNLFAESDVVLTQLEIPVRVVEKTIAMAGRYGATMILNPAPARDLPVDLLAGVDILTPNTTEAETLSGIEVRDPGGAARAGVRLVEMGAAVVIVTLGAQGSIIANDEGSRHIPAWSVEAVDSTAAGDAFNGALAHALASGKSIDDAVDVARTVAAYSVTRMGAQISMPTPENLRDFEATLVEAAPHSP